MDIRQESLKKHYEWNGKIEVIARCPIESRQDLSLAYTPGVAEPCLEINDVFVCGPNYEKKVAYSWEDLADLPLILLEKNASSRLFLEDNLTPLNISLNPLIEVAVHDLLIRLASIHLGISCVIEEFSKEELERGIIKKLNLSPPLPKRSIGYAYIKNAPLSYAAKAFIDLIK